MTTPQSPVGEEDVRNTNIEVCVRVRPLAVSNDFSFFETKTRPSSPTNVIGGRVRPPSRLSRPGSSIRNMTPRQTPRKQPIPESSSQISATLDDARPAWDVVDIDTLQQSASTTHVQGRTHSYTLDRVYGPISTTSELFQHSLRPVVESAMDGYHASVFAYGQTSTGTFFLHCYSSIFSCFASHSRHHQLSNDSE